MNTPATPKIQRIQQLSTQLANQIAAGEVVERPASVVKELLENSLDAGATQIEIEVEQGGLRLIRIHDNGAGIFSEDLPLALSRHATSKVSSLFDLEHLTSLGFRGEALPSIASVSRLQIITRRHDAAQASCIEVSSSGEISEVRPAAHPPGTTVVVADLFCNTPARRRFQRAAKTEFSHIQDIVQRIALARADIAIQLRHNDRQVIKVTSASESFSALDRMARIFGQAFVDSAYTVAAEMDGLRIQGYAAPASLHRAQTDRQYVYINGRVVKDRVLSHAIRQAYSDQLPEGRYASYLLRLEIDPVLVDVNVHPTKHEVRFRDGRNVHDFLFTAVQRSLQGQPAAEVSKAKVAVQPTTMRTPLTHEVRERAAVYAMPLREVPGNDIELPFGDVLSLLEDRFLLCRKAQQHCLIDTRTLLKQLYRQRLQNELQQEGGVVSRPLLLPERLVLLPNQAALIEEQSETLQRLGFELTLSGDATALLRRAPVILQQANQHSLGLALLEMLGSTPEQEQYRDLAHAAALSTPLPEGCRHQQTWLAKQLDMLEDDAPTDWLVQLDSSSLHRLFPEFT
ncbi:MAG: DNA mismatch repair endonuclease MutL [Sulfuriflexus sp.]|nr:DNA mismatch repair endonuclease MutL [Sulfuriflexus sp.]